LAIGVLIWDNAVHAAPASGPDPVQANPAPAPPAAPAPAVAAVASDKTAAPEEIQSLQAWQALPRTAHDSSDNISFSHRDVFQMSSTFQKTLLESRRHNPKFQDVPPAPLPRLKAILIADQRQYALLDEEVLGPGQAIGPYRLVQIRRDSVVLTGPEKKPYTLSIDDSNLSEPAAPPKAKTAPALR